MSTLKRGQRIRLAHVSPARKAMAIRQRRAAMVFVDPERKFTFGEYELDWEAAKNLVGGVGEHGGPKTFPGMFLIHHPSLKAAEGIGCIPLCSLHKEGDRYELQVELPAGELIPDVSDSNDWDWFSKTFNVEE